MGPVDGAPTIPSCREGEALISEPGGLRCVPFVARDASAPCREGEILRQEPGGLRCVSVDVRDASLRMDTTTVDTPAARLESTLTVRWTINGAPASTASCMGAAVRLHLNQSVRNYSEFPACDDGVVTFSRVAVGDYTLTVILSVPGHNYDEQRVPVRVSATTMSVDVPLSLRGTLGMAWTVNGQQNNCPVEPGMNGRPTGTVTLEATPQTGGAPTLSMPVPCPDNGILMPAHLQLPVGAYRIVARLTDPARPAMVMRGTYPQLVDIAATNFGFQQRFITVDIPCGCCMNPPPESACP